MLIWIGVGVLLALGGMGGLLAGGMSWVARQTFEDRYFSRPAAERRALKRRIRGIARWLAPPMSLLARFGVRLPVAEYRGVKVPGQACPVDAMAQAAGYVPDERDVFVATQMKCGTTWMQQVVYETLSRGHGDLSDDGHRHMYALSPWIESRASVSMEDAPRVDPGGHRIVKTHLPTSLCPYSERARYIYVVRHPLACFASSVDFVRKLAGPLSFTPPEFVDWFCSDDMWWRSWPEHVDGWWRWAAERPNVRFVHYEDMLLDLPKCVSEIAAFLEVELSDEEQARVVEKSGYAWMKEHEEVFEMAAPTPLDAGGGSFLVSGRADRDRDVAATDRARIAAFCRDRLAGSAYPLARFYPDVVTTAD